MDTSTKKHAEKIKKNRLTKLETFCGPAARENRLSVKEFETPLFGYDVVEHTAGCSSVQDGGRGRAAVPLRSELLHGGIFAVHVR